MSGSVWVLEEGSYSSYRVLGVYTTKANAEAVAAVMNEKYERVTVDKWTLDPGLEGLAPHCEPFSVTMDHLGQVLSVGRSFEIPEGMRTGSRKKQPVVTGEVWARDEGHAIKIANEYRVQAIAEGRLRTG